MKTQDYKDLHGIDESEFRKYDFKEKKGRRIGISTLVNKDGKMASVKFQLCAKDPFSIIYLDYSDVEIVKRP